jgi:hypothetical protein
VVAGILWFFFICFLYLCGAILCAVYAVTTGDLGK